MILLARPLRTGELERLHRHRYVVVPDWLTRAQTGRLQADAVAVGADSGFESAVGSVNFGTARVDTEVRRSRQCSIYPPPRNAAGSVTERDGLVSAVNGLRRELEAAALPALPRLAPFETELNYLLYPIGGHYKRHLDQPRGNSGWQRQGRRAADGGSISGGRSAAVSAGSAAAAAAAVTAAAVGTAATAEAGSAEAAAAAEGAEGAVAEMGAGGLADEASGWGEYVEDVAPNGGTLVLLMSGEYSGGAPGEENAQGEAVRRRLVPRAARGARAGLGRVVGADAGLARPRGDGQLLPRRQRRVALRDTRGWQRGGAIGREEYRKRPHTSTVQRGRGKACCTSIWDKSVENVPNT
ncbi:hypothetical protein EMIHUDRAFT_432519 [Emiliania huxleyi CCMP1516]|uniref:Prolyl 4-hydroxylase alpha subunit domain-containing protein n=2 Tax=Emiliania huxleyi TaxID=2903 RepID=A0A0D3ITK2_EMIH1|nr:hypothetical protein EMIHUDRAFT_432519 [Emiliania huxleyi CCMP1516]EOD14587.1 hypothetical protein EMIHUDRAFT_432519 [Emiliania huxleyi CCMP1516]|eukprot:XP_005767016.1 hypothetical protein EMIHUDRAFT_432519 [Emiliania huxleyi CCMP1516]